MKRSTLNHGHAVWVLVVACLIVSGSGSTVPGLPTGFGAQAVHAASSGAEIVFQVDVAIDCRTWRFNRNISFQAAGRGDSFLADGRIFPANTLKEEPTQSDDPNKIPGSIGKWTQRGTMAATVKEIDSGTRPAFFATWFFHFLDEFTVPNLPLIRRGSALVADGPHPESAMAVVGGMGGFAGASGELSDEIIGTNITGCPNLRLTIRLKEQTP